MIHFCFQLSFFCRLCKEAFSFFIQRKGSSVGLCVCSLAPGFSLTRSGVRFFPTALQILISTRFLQSWIFSESLRSEQWKWIFFRNFKVLSQYGKCEITRGADFWDFCLVKTVFLNLGICKDLKGSLQKNCLRVPYIDNGHFLVQLHNVGRFEQPNKISVYKLSIPQGSGFTVDIWYSICLILPVGCVAKYEHLVLDNTENEPSEFFDTFSKKRIILSVLTENDFEVFSGKWFKLFSLKQ